MDNFLGFEEFSEELRDSIMEEVARVRLPDPRAGPQGRRGGGAEGMNREGRRERGGEEAAAILLPNLRQLSTPPQYTLIPFRASAKSIGRMEKGHKRKWPKSCRCFAGTPLPPLQEDQRAQKPLQHQGQRVQGYLQGEYC